MAVSLSLVGAALLLKQGAAKAEVEWQRGTQVTVWMVPTAPTSEIKAVGAQLATLSYVDQPCIYRTHQQDWNEARALLGTVWKEGGTTVAQTPTSFRCTPVHPEDANAVIAKFNGPTRRAEGDGAAGADPHRAEGHHLSSSGSSSSWPWCCWSRPPCSS